MSCTIGIIVSSSFSLPYCFVLTLFADVGLSVVILVERWNLYV